MRMTRLLAAGTLAAGALGAGRRPGRRRRRPRWCWRRTSTSGGRCAGGRLADVVEPAELGVLRRFERTRAGGAGGGRPGAGADRDPRCSIPDWARALENPDLPAPLDREALAFVEYLKSRPRGTAGGGGAAGANGSAAATGGRGAGPRRGPALAGLRGAGPQRVRSGGDGGRRRRRVVDAADRNGRGRWGWTVGFWKDGRRDPLRATEAVARFVADRGRAGRSETLLSLFRGPRPARTGRRGQAAATA